ncbi:MAG: phosphotransferase [Defluviitaleaceae bacterium]|nr:phosphotransferase [Defluviitaleaceae bacterium]
MESQQCELIAAEIFRQYDLSFETAKRAGGWTNAVWLNGDVVLRLSLTKDSNKIRREVELAQLFPKVVGYPSIITTGITDGFEWSLSKRISGVNLSDVWSELSWQERAKAVHQIFDIMQAVHSVDISRVEHLSLRRSWYSAFAKTESVAEIESYVSQKYFTVGQGRNLCDIVENFYNQLGQTPLVLNHGDITMDNILWHEGEVVSLMDFEHSAISASQMDLHSMINLALIPDDDVLKSDAETSNYIEDMVKSFKPTMTRPGDKDLLLGYAFLFRQRFFEFWLNSPEGDINKVDAYQKLLSLSGGDGGFMKAFL